MSPEIAKAVAAVLRQWRSGTPAALDASLNRLRDLVGEPCVRCDGGGLRDAATGRAGLCEGCAATGYPALRPSRYEVCPTCRGLGPHRSVDVSEPGDELTWEQFLSCSDCGAGNCRPGVREVKA